MYVLQYTGNLRRYNRVDGYVNPQNADSVGPWPFRLEPHGDESFLNMESLSLYVRAKVVKDVAGVEKDLEDGDTVSPINMFGTM
jgi:hypothetical protein